MASKPTKEQLEHMRKAAQDKRRAEGGKVAIDAILINNNLRGRLKRDSYTAFKTHTDTGSHATTSQPEDTERPCCSANAYPNANANAIGNTQAKLLPGNSDWTFAVPASSSATKLNASAKPKKFAYMNIVPKAKATVSNNVTITAADNEISLDSDSDGDNDGPGAKASADIWASMKPRKLPDELPGRISEIDERMVRAWKRKHFYGVDHDGTPINDTCICGLMKPCCLAVMRMVQRQDRIMSNEE